MSSNALEIDMLSLGNADSLLATSWANGNPTRVLIDGGTADSAETVRTFLRTHGITHINHVVATHPDNDHAGGLVAILADRALVIDKFWVQIPHYHVDMNLLNEALSRSARAKLAQTINESIQRVAELFAAASARQIPIEEPFAGKQIAFLTVCGPTQAHYEELVLQFRDADSISRLDVDLIAADKSEEAELLLEDIVPDNDSTSLLDNPVTTPENNTCVIMATAFQGQKHLFTSDASAQSLALAAKAYDLRNCEWMQIPHHGSRRNITAGLIDIFKPKIAFVSAKGGKKHPRRSVVNAFKQKGTSVYSTHYPDGNNSLLHQRGDATPRPGYGPAKALWVAG